MAAKGAAGVSGIEPRQGAGGMRSFGSEVEALGAAGQRGAGRARSWRIKKGRSGCGEELAEAPGTGNRERVCLRIAARSLLGAGSQASTEIRGERATWPHRQSVSGSPSIAGRVAIFLVRMYRTLSWRKLPSCRFVPSCSEYALDAFKIHGFFRASFLTAWRIMRCNPFGGSGFDPVPLPKLRGPKDGDCGASAVVR
jgi:putative membrane protein insertion efficiency factor